jgi:pentatricopeptide repeat protein
VSLKHPKTLMRRITLLRPPPSLLPATTLHSFTTLLPYNNGGSSSKHPKKGPTLTFTSNSRWVFTDSNYLPPPEWIEPFNDLSDIASKTPQDLKPSPWVHQIMSLLLDGSVDMESRLDLFCNKFLIKLSPNFVSFVLKSMELQKRPDLALKFFTWAGKQKKYTHNLQCYVSLIDVLAINGDLDNVKSVFFKFRGMGFLMNVSAANSLIKSFGSLGMVEELLWVWRGMKENGVEPSLFTYNFLLNGLVNSVFIESAERVLEVMENGKIGPDVVTYNTMIKGYCQVGKTQKAFEKFRDMELRNVAPDKITYMTLIQACYAEGDFDLCLSLYHEMDENGLEIQPHAYGLIIGGL